MNILAWIVLGFLAGAIAKAIYPGYQPGGILTTILLGIVGAFIGGTLFNFLSTGSLAIVSTSLSIPGLVVAVIGAMIAVFLWGALSRRSRYY
ncbi:MAG: GlsB/YeaQ/YmgE family stress response membrane protein [Cyanobacteria bacterium CRU_2_1]|nr:GlsB/YeaQ/YmgE family stress response membrane protein [Cyanobacteria bacterium RU_5_0]NJR60358.1 GlsB/YeaQ/YmgE family stress response membrane protein [Cyanobacteria bacterium CRU_2_1]